MSQRAEAWCAASSENGLRRRVGARATVARREPRVGTGIDAPRVRRFAAAAVAEAGVQEGQAGNAERFPAVGIKAINEQV